jgi:hypothetical protein
MKNPAPQSARGPKRLLWVTSQLFSSFLRGASCLKSPRTKFQCGTYRIGAQLVSISLWVANEQFLVFFLDNNSGTARNVFTPEE